MTKLNEKREKMLAKYLDDQDNIGELNSRHMDDRCQAWAKGFDCAIAEVMPMLEEMAGALEFYASIHVWGNGAAEIDPCDQYKCDFGVMRGGKQAIKTLDIYAKWKEGIK